MGIVSAPPPLLVPTSGILMAKAAESGSRNSIAAGSAINFGQTKVKATRFNAVPPPCSWWLDKPLFNQRQTAIIDITDITDKDTHRNEPATRKRA